MTLSEIPQWTTLSFLLVLRSPNSAFILISCVPASKPNGLENILTSKYTIPVFGEFAYALSGLKYPGAPETLKGQFCCHNLPWQWPSEFADLAIRCSGRGDPAATTLLVPGSSRAGLPVPREAGISELVTAGSKTLQLLPFWLCQLILQNCPGHDGLWGRAQSVLWRAPKCRRPPRRPEPVRLPRVHSYSPSALFSPLSSFLVLSLLSSRSTLGGGKRSDFVQVGTEHTSQWNASRPIY